MHDRTAGVVGHLPAHRLFARDIATNHGFGYWSYTMILSVVGLSLAAYIAERRRQKAALRVAAIALNAREGMLITDEQAVILQANQSFLRMSGYEASEVLGKTLHFLQPAAGTLPDSPEPPAPWTSPPATPCNAGNGCAANRARCTRPGSLSALSRTRRRIPRITW